MVNVLRIFIKLLYVVVLEKKVIVYLLRRQGNLLRYILMV